MCQFQCILIVHFYIWLDFTVYFPISIEMRENERENEQFTYRDDDSNVTKLRAQNVMGFLCSCLVENVGMFKAKSDWNVFIPPSPSPTMINIPFFTTNTFKITFTYTNFNRQTLKMNIMGFLLCDVFFFFFYSPL